jgi:hypothetical protein
MQKGNMYTGTLISDLMATVQRAEQKSEQHQMACERELHAIFTMQVSIAHGDQIFMGAA